MEEDRDVDTAAVVTAVVVGAGMELAESTGDDFASRGKDLRLFRDLRWR